MKNRIFVALLAVFVLFAGGCAYVNIKTPFDTNLDNTEFGTKIGKAHNYSLFWLVAWGDASYAAAAKNGKLKVMKHADQEIKQYFLGMYTKRTVVVYGD